MAKKIILTVSAVLAFGFGSALRSNAGTEVIDRYSAAPAPAYNYAPPPPVNVLIFPAYGYYGPRFGVHRFYGRHVYWRTDHHWR
jgi:hypothetical protein